MRSSAVPIDGRARLGLGTPAGTALAGVRKQGGKANPLPGTTHHDLCHRQKRAAGSNSRASPHNASAVREEMGKLQGAESR